MNALPLSIQNLVKLISQFPGIGQKSAVRIAIWLALRPKKEIKKLVDAIIDLKKKLKICPICFNLDEKAPCRICSDLSRKKNLICVVEDFFDLISVEKTGFKGTYHILWGLINPTQGIGPKELKIKELIDRIKTLKKKYKNIEVILATNPTVEGEATAIYLQKTLTPFKIRITKLAKGIPEGADLEYTDEITLKKAIEGRRELK